MSSPHWRTRAFRWWAQTCASPLFLTIGVLLAAPGFSWGETGFQGTVQDPSGGAVSSAVVRAGAVITGKTVETTANSEGKYRLVNLPPGAYRVEVVETAFEDFRSDILILEGKQVRTISPRLRLKALTHQVVVTGARREEDLLSSPIPTLLIERPAIQDSATQTLEQLLIEQAGSGVYVSRSFGLGWPSINGIGGSRVLVLVDGQRQIGTDNGTRDGIDLDQFTTANVERIEVVKGASAPLYGSDAMGGVIQIITREPRQPFSFEFDTSHGSFGESNLSSTLGLSKDRLGALVSGVYQDFDGYDLNQTNPGTTGFSGGENAFIDRQVSPSVYYDFTDSAKFRVNSNYYRRNTNFISSQGGDLPDAIQERWSLSPRLNFTLGSAHLVTLRGDVSAARRFDLSRVETLRHFEGIGSSQLTPANTLQYGFDIRHKQLTRPGLGSEEDITVSLGPAGMRSVAVRSVWMQDEVRLLSNRLTLSAGFRVENNSQFGNNFSPKAGAVLRLTDRNRFRFSYGEGFRAPDVSELYRGFTSSRFFAFVGNPRLTPEESRSYSAGWTFFHPRIRYSLDFFYNRFQNGIGFALVSPNDPFDPFFERFLQPGGPSLYTNRNLGDFDARGANNGLDVLLPYGFRTTFNYTLLDRIRVSDSDTDGTRLVGLGNLRNSAFFKIGWSRDSGTGSRRWNLSTNLRSTIRGREGLSTTSRFDRPSDTSRIGQTEYVPSYQSWDFLLAAEAPWGERVRIRPYFGINNLADFVPRGFQYQDGSAVMNGSDDPNGVLFREPGRTIKGGVKLRF